MSYATNKKARKKARKKDRVFFLVSRIEEAEDGVEDDVEDGLVIYLVLAKSERQAGQILQSHGVIRRAGDLLEGRSWLEWDAKDASVAVSDFIKASLQENGIAPESYLPTPENKLQLLHLTD